MSTDLQTTDESSAALIAPAQEHHVPAGAVVPPQMSGGPFWPVDPPIAAKHEAAAAYRSVPSGMRVLAALQALTALAMLVAHWQMGRVRAFAPDDVISALLCALAVVAGVKLCSACGWAWWVSCALLYLAAVTVAGGMLKAQLAGASGIPIPGLVIALALCAALVYLSLPSVLRTVRFRSGVLPSAMLRLSAATAGFGLALIRLGLQLAL